MVKNRPWDWFGRIIYEKDYVEARIVIEFFFFRVTCKSGQFWVLKTKKN